MVEYYNEKTKKTANWSDIVSQNPTASFPKVPSDDIAKHLVGKFYIMEKYQRFLLMV